ncbi:MAG: PQQ-dependent sugar dehydrogenase [Myxococcales bacterium]|jgi:glucose/arabinose dehydrogenase
MNERRFAGIAVLWALACTGCGSDDSAGSAGAGGDGAAMAPSGGRDSDSGSGSDTDTDTRSDTDSGSGSGSGSDTASYMDTDTDTDTDTGADAGSDSGTDAAAESCAAPVPATEYGNACPAQDPAPLTATLLTDALQYPVFLTAAPNDGQRLFVLERSGQIELLDRDTGESLGTFLDLNVNYGGERGLLGLAFHPEYPEDPRFFVNYTADGPRGLQTVVASFEVAADDPDRAAPDSEVRLLAYDQPESNHNGGMVAFGPDGCLYVGSGDGGGSGDGLGDPSSAHAPEGNGQYLDTHLGKLLRLSVDTPEENAPGNLQDAPASHIWDYGLRNPWRFSFDRDTGDLYIGDVGQNAREEIDVAPAGHGNNNWGWRVAEGTACYESGCTTEGLQPPAHDYMHVDDDLDCVIGGYVYRGSAIPSLQGWYVYGDNGPGLRTYAFVWNGSGTCAPPIELTEQLDVADEISSFGQDADGELYITAVGGQVYRIEAAP